MSMKITEASQTVFFVQRDGNLQQLVRLSIACEGQARDAVVEAQAGGQRIRTVIGSVVPGESVYEAYIPDLEQPSRVDFRLLIGEELEDRFPVDFQPTKHWQVHVIHYSHHDIGYTDLPTHVLAEYSQFYESVLQYCRATEDFPEEAKFRYTAEEACTLLNYLQNAEADNAAELISYLKSGRIEVTALFGNQTTELCGHEQIIRALYPALRLRREHGVQVCSAMLNDIPGASWALASVLPRAGIRHLFVGIPAWYFGKKLSDRRLASTDYEVHSLWDESRVLNLETQGAFRWEGPDGHQVVFWYDVHGSGDELQLWDYQQTLGDVTEKLRRLENSDYPYDFARYTVRGGRDNSPPLLDTSYVIRQWNSRWAYPKLIFSTNYGFIKQLDSQGVELPVLRGELPNTDYTIGALAAAKETGVNRITHDRLLGAEKFATVAAQASDYVYPGQDIEAAYTDSLYFDMHCSGLNHTAGPGQDANWAEKSTFAYRAAALSQDVMVKSCNKIADEIRRDDDMYHLIVFNPLSFSRTDLVACPFKEFSPCRKPMYWSHSEALGYSRHTSGSAVGRRLVELPGEFAHGAFDLFDAESGEKVPHQIVEIKSPREPLPSAAERFALGQLNEAELYQVVFVAGEVPSLGYKTYRLIPSKNQVASKSSIEIGEASIENRFFSITLDPESGTVSGIFDKKLQRELVDARAKHGFNQLIARRSQKGIESYPTNVRITGGNSGGVSGYIRIESCVEGCPSVIQDIVVYDNIPRIDFRSRMLRDSTPLLELYFGFPFLVEKPHFTFESNSSAVEPLIDQLPGSNTDYYAMQHWVDVAGSDWGIVFSSLESPMIECGGLWPGYVSGAHHCVTPPDYGHPFMVPGDIDKGHLYSYIMNNNFRTNFRNTQVSDLLFHYSMSTHKGHWRAAGVQQFGWSFSNPLIPVVVKGRQNGSLPQAKSFCSVEQPNVLLQTLKKADDGQGTIVRLLEIAGRETETMVNIPFLTIDRAYQANAFEENEGVLSASEHAVKVPITANGTATVRILSPS